jgi:hypothetical protein
VKLKAVEKFLIRSPLRAHMLQRLEAPRVLSNLDIGERNVCLDIGCGSGIGALLITGLWPFSCGHQCRPCFRAISICFLAIRHQALRASQ